MGWQPLDYSLARDRMQAGDIIAFSSNAGFSPLIKMATRSSVTHVGIVFQTKLLIDGEVQPGFFNQVMEATVVSSGQAGVVANRLSDRLKYYPGELWWLPIRANVRRTMNLKNFYNFLLHSEHKTYDLVQAIKSAFDIPKTTALPGKLAENAEDYAKIFCSELAAGALEVSGAIANVNASEVTPIDLCRFAIYEADYYQLKGKAKYINGYNSLNPNGWGQP